MAIARDWMMQLRPRGRGASPQASRAIERGLGSRWPMFLERLRASLRVLPLAMLCTSIGAAAATLLLDRHLGTSTMTPPWWASAGPEGTRVTLSTIAGSVMTVAGVAFSITILVLQLASTQYSPRVIRSFRRDRLIQVVLGVYTGTFMYSLVVLRAIADRADGASFTAPISVTVAMVLGMICMVLLAVFVHHIAQTVQVSKIVRTIADETRACILHMYPESLGAPREEDEDVEEDASSSELDDAPQRICAPRDGYIDYIDTAAIDAITDARLVRIEVRPGDFVRAHEPLASVWPRPGAPCPLDDDLDAVFAIADERTLQQDARFGLRLAVDVALRALSPGINDPSTAVHCVDVLGGLLCTLARRDIPSARRRTEHQSQVIAPVVGFDEMLCTAFDEILEFAQRSPPVQLALAEALRSIAQVARTPSAARAVARVAERVRETTDQTKCSEPIRSRICDATTAASLGMRGLRPA